MKSDEVVYKHAVILSGEKLKNHEPVFSDVCIVCGKACDSDRISIKAWLDNYTFFAELSRTREFKVPAHLTMECGLTFLKRWKFAKYAPVFTDTLALVISISVLYFFSFFPFLISGVSLILASAIFQVYLRLGYRLPLKISQSLTLTKINYQFEFANADMARDFETRNIGLLLE